MAEPAELPSRLAILPFRNKVLLPGAIIRIRCTSPSSVKLVEQELWQKEEKGLIGVLPVRDTEAAATLIFRGVAARALHLSRGVEKPSGRVTYIVVLEGWCRFSVQELSARGTYYVARISRLDLTKSGKVLYCAPLLIYRSVPLYRHIVGMKQKTVGRTKVLLETVPVHRLADIFVASFEISFEEQLLMLDSVDLKMRAIKEELGDNDDDEDDLAALERRMQGAGMPPNIWKHAQRELR
ncbi:hypothetical protein BHE74_00006354 [Ensete ventricosum]|nr:hypothetical protein BHE74_00006354 [Ensete ventricosum]